MRWAAMMVPIFLVAIQLVTWKVGYAGVRVGEAAVPGPTTAAGARAGAASRPGLQTVDKTLPCKFGSANVTSLVANLDATHHLELSACALQETRLNEWAQIEMRRQMAEHGWQLICGKAQPRQQRKRETSSEWNARHGGVAVMVRDGFPASRGPVDTDTRRRLWESGRWVHVEIAAGEGRQVVHLMSIYGHTGADRAAEPKQKNEAFLKDVFLAAAELGDVPIMIAGDFNVVPERSAMICNAVGTGKWFDVAVEFAKASGITAAPTCHSSTAGTRIDAIIANVPLLAAAQDFSVLNDTGLPTHSPLVLQLDPRQYRQKICRIVRPAAFAVEAWEAIEQDAEEDLALECLLQNEQGWAKAKEDKDVEGMWRAWCKAAESYLHKRSQAGRDAAHKESGRSGRWKNMDPQMRYTAASQGRGDLIGKGGAEDLKQRRLARLARQWEELLRQRRSVLGRGLGQHPQETQLLWQSICKLAKLVVPEARWPLLPSIPDVATGEVVLADLRKKLATHSSAIREQRVENWRRWLQQQWREGGRHRGKVFREVSGRGLVLSSVLARRQDGTTTANINEIHAMLKATWDPVFRRYADTPEPSWGTFSDRFSKHFHHHPMNLDDITADGLRIALSKMRDSQAAGAEGWRVAEVKRLPAPLLKRMAVFLNAVEAAGQWPVGLERAIVSLIPKEEEVSSAEFRPISVMSVIYRLWAAVRLQDVMAWQEAWIHHSQHGARKLHGTADVFWPLALRVEHALLTGKPLYGLSLDYQKCFDSLPQKILLQLSKEMGLHERVLRPLGAMYSSLRRRLLFAGSAGEEFVATNGILQGCPLSLVLLNALLAVWARCLEEEVPEAKTDAYVDDTGATAARPKTLQQVLEITGEFASVTGQTLNLRKSCTYATSTARMRPLRLRGQTLPVVSVAKSVGVRMSVNEAGVQQRKHRLEEAKQIADRLSFAPLPFEARVQLVSGLVLPRGLYECTAAPFPKKDTHKLRNAVLRGILGNKRSRSCAEIVFTLLGPGHRLDPQQAVAYQALVMLQRMLLKRFDLYEVYSEAWVEIFSQRGRSDGPLQVVREAVDLIGASWTSPLVMKLACGTAVDLTEVTAKNGHISFATACATRCAGGRRKEGQTWLASALVWTARLLRLCLLAISCSLQAWRRCGRLWQEGFGHKSELSEQICSLVPCALSASKRLRIMHTFGGSVPGGITSGRRMV